MNKIKICIVGLGYVGLPIAVILSKKFQVLGYDINKNRIKELNNKIDITKEVDTNKLKKNNKNLKFTYDCNKIKDCNFFIITVPTPVDKKFNPNLKYLKEASQTVSKYLKKNDTVVYESTTFPGCTEDICIPILEKVSNLKINKDFYCGYSPERINPGDKIHRINNISKIISASNHIGLKLIKKIYKNVTKKKLIVVNSIKIAEGAKIIENTQRDINIALMNELSMLFYKLKIDFSEILKAANTKWNFLDFKPGLVGGHCIGVDPYYLAFKAKKIKFNPKVILSGRSINEYMYQHVIRKFEKKIYNNINKSIKKKILIVGLTFKENVPDCRNSQSIKIAERLAEKKLVVYTFDPLVKKKISRCNPINTFSELKKYKNFFDGIIILVPHSSIVKKGYVFYKNLKKNNCIFFDIKNCFRNKSDFSL